MVDLCPASSRLRFRFLAATSLLNSTSVLSVLLQSVTIEHSAPSGVLPFG
uniref:Uncharacterized protein n=1 Tax=Ornithorhynchus anatinus TaxID=9258 RepID=A0A6I8NF46_ORNAN